VARRRLFDRQQERPELLLSDLKTRLIIGAARMRTAKHRQGGLLHALWLERLFVGKVAVIKVSGAVRLVLKLTDKLTEVVLL